MDKLRDIFDLQKTEFHTSAEVRMAILHACRENADLAHYHTIGRSRHGRLLYAVVLGTGPKTVSLIAGAHSDEPVGPETLRTFILQGLEKRQRLEMLFAKFRFVVIPHVNPDGEMKNAAWIARWPDVTAYLQQVCRELPGDDVEFGFPNLRRENRCVAAFWRRQPPIRLHISFHGMGFSEGALLLIDRRWIGRTRALQREFVRAVRAHNLRLHDHDRGGEKGFAYIAPGFTTTPERARMAAFFTRRGDTRTANLFRDSSMDFVRTLSPDPLCLVTELPLYQIRKETVEPKPGVPQNYLAFRDLKPALLNRLRRGESIDDALRAFEIQPVPLQSAIKLQLTVLDLALAVIESER